MVSEMVSGPRGFVSVGYEQRTVDELVGLLSGVGVATLVDVRLNPVSRKPGFSKRALASVLADAGIVYRHERSLGNPVENREPFRQGSAESRRRFLRVLDGDGAPAFERLIGLARGSRVAVLCFERDHDRCHRSCIVDAAVAADPGLGAVLRL